MFEPFVDRILKIFALTSQSIFVEGLEMAQYIISVTLVCSIRRIVERRRGVAAISIGWRVCRVRGVFDRR